MIAESTIFPTRTADIAEGHLEAAEGLVDKGTFSDDVAGRALVEICVQQLFELGRKELTVGHYIYGNDQANQKVPRKGQDAHEA